MSDPVSFRVAPAQARTAEPGPLNTLRGTHAPSSTTQAGDHIVRSSTNQNDGLTMGKNAVVGLAANRTLPHRYELRSIPQEINPKSGKLRNTSVAGIFDTKANIGATTGIARGRFELRFDQSHGYRGTTVGPHINIGAGEHTAIDVPKPIIDAAGVAARSFEGLDRVAMPVGVAIDTARLASALHADGGTIGVDTIRTARNVAGGWVGAFTGAAAGAEIGGAVGLFAGPAGAAVGAVAGGLIGGIGGSFGGAILSEEQL